jgi:hypothetical protein
MYHDKVNELLNQAKESIYDPNTRMAFWRAYIAVEYAVLDVKLRYKIEGQLSPKPTKENNPLVSVKFMLKQIDPCSADKKKLLYDLRVCRDMLKELVTQSYD